MAYKKIIVDNPTCSRRFHLAYDDTSSEFEKVEIKCPHCQQAIFEKESHPHVGLIREENLVSMTNLSNNIVDKCQLKDDFPAHKPTD